MKFIPITYRILMDSGDTKVVAGFAFESGTDACLCVRYDIDHRGFGWRVNEYTSGCLMEDAGVNHATPESAAVAGIVMAAFRMGARQWDPSLELACARSINQAGAQP